MDISNFHVKKRQQEQEKVKKLLVAGFVGSTLLHGILIATFPSWGISQAPKNKKKPIELVLVDKPKPKPPEPKVIPKPEPKPKPPETKVVNKPKPRSKPKFAPKPKARTPQPPKPQPAVTPKPQVTTPVTPKETTPQVITSKPREVITTPFPTTNTVPSESAQTENTGVVNNEVKEPTSSSPVATNSPPLSPKPITDPGGVKCVANCQPKYPSALDGAEGSAGVKLTINSSGNVTGAQLVQANGNAILNRQALLAARRMRFGKINNQAGAIVTVKINFTVKGSEFDRVARQRQAELERERKAKLEEEHKQRETARQAELERERQAKLEEERKKQEAARQAELEKRRQQESSATPTNRNNLTDKEQEDEMLHKFRERIQQRQE